MATYTVTTGNDVTQYTVSTGARGPMGPIGTLTSYVDQVESLDDYPATFPADHAPVTVSGNGISLSGQQVSLSIGTASNQVAAGDHTHAQLHDAVTVSGNGLSLSGQQISLSIGTGSTQVAAGNHTHAQLHDRQHSVTSTSDHTFPGGTTTFLRADGTFATPPTTTVDNTTVNAAIDEDEASTWGILGPTGFKYGILFASGATNANSGVNYIAVEQGESAGDITVAHVISGTGNTASVSVSGRAITVTAGSNCTQSTIVSEVNGSPDAASLVTAYSIGTGTTLVRARAATNLKSPLTQDSNGSFTFGYPVEDSVGLSSRAFLSLSEGPGNLWLQDMKCLGWKQEDGTNGPYIYFWDSHDGTGGEWLFNSPGAHAFIGTMRTQFGNNDASRDTQYLQFVSGSASSTDTLRASRGVAMRCYWWDGDSAERSSMGFQAVPTSTTGTGNKVLKFWDDMKVYGESGDGGIAGTATQTGDFTGVQIGEMHKEGFWNPGISSEYITLTAESNVFTQACSKYRTVQQAKLTLGDTNSLAISGATNGMRGVIYVKQPVAGSKTLALPSGSLRPDPWALSTTPSAVDRLSWEYDGSNYLWSMVKGFIAGPDADVTDFVSSSRANITDETIIDALNDFVTALKGANIWSKFDAIYPFVGGNATAHSKNLLADTYNLTYPVALTHDANGITGTGSGYALTGINLQTLGRKDSCFIYLYSKSDSPTDGAYWFGSTTATEWCTIVRSGSNPYYRGINCISQSAWTAVTDFSNDFAWNRESSTSATLYSGAFSNFDATATSSAPDVNFPIMCRNNSGTYANFTNMNMAMFAIGQGLTPAEVGIFRTAANTFQTALGRANS